MGGMLSGQKIAPYDPGQRNRKRIEDTAHKGWETRAAPLWGDGVRMKKLTKLITEMEKTGKDSIHVNDAATIMENSADSAGQMITGCKRFERISKGTYKLLPKGKETEQTLGGRVQGVKVDKIIAFMARKNRTEILVGDAAELTGATTNNIYNQLIRDERMVKTGRGRFGLATEHKPEAEHKPVSAPAQNDDPDELSLDEKMARSKMPEDILAQSDTTAQEDKMKSIQEGKLSVPVDAYQTKEAEQEQKRKEKALRDNIIEALGSRLEMINKQEEEIKGLREENERLNARLADKPIKDAYSNTSPPTAQPADEPRKIIKLSLCPHCGKQIITD